MIARAFIKTQCHEFRGIETEVVADDYRLIGMIYAENGHQNWCVCKGDNILDVSIEAIEIAKSVLKISAEKKIDYTDALEFYFDDLEEKAAIAKKNKRTLNVIQVSQKEIERNWKTKLPASFFNRELFIRCNSKGKINWEVAPIYTQAELDKRGNYTILIVIDMEEVIKSEL